MNLQGTQEDGTPSYVAGRPLYTPALEKTFLALQRLTKVMIATPSTSPCLDVRSADSQNRTLRKQHD